ncbi:MAG: fused MFS/spermidine synthase [Pseudomonadales bacterium]|nr:fused MFS/spermidine synthase [Pseudomonadales bacterium]
MTSNSLDHITKPKIFNALVLILAFSSGFIIMSVELLGGRILAPYFGSSIYVWGSIITIFMASLAIGYLLGGRLSLTNPNLKQYGLFYLGAAVTLLPIVFMGDQMMDAVFLRIEDPRYGSLVASVFLFTLPSITLGLIAPYSVRLLVTDAKESGAIAGGLFFVSTIGSALGTLATSFYFILWFDINEILITMICFLVLSCIAAFLGDYYLVSEETD